MPSLIDLLRAAPDVVEPPHAPITVTAITADSRKVTPGALFVALKGTKTDASQYIQEAITKGAVAVLCDSSPPLEGGQTNAVSRGGYEKDRSVPPPNFLTEIPPPLKGGAVIIHSSNVRRSLSQLAAAFYAKQPQHIVAITGTDGKTSTADFYRQFWHHLGKPSASIGTLGVLEGKGAALYPESQTTPDPVSLHKMLAEMAEQHIQHVAMEASSHGLDQYRLDGVRLEAAAFTNLTRDHLDYHQTDEAYFAAKLRLFSKVLPAGKTAVLNQDDARYHVLAKACHQHNMRVVGFGVFGKDYKIAHLAPSAHGQTAQLEIHGKPYRLEVPLAGAFQVYNIVTALALVEATGGNIDDALKVIPKLTGVPGRIECVARLSNGAAVYIDYAHTPMALANILKTLRPHTKHKLHVVFGCGGDRDTGKRPEMGRFANELADIVIVTDDNPRSENPAAIRKAILAATPRGKEIADRKQAIYAALEGLGAGDILVIAGKGHEKTQTVGDKITPFDDAEVARQGVKELKLAA